MNFNDTLGSSRDDLFGGSFQPGNSNNAKSKREQIWEEKRKQKLSGGGGGPVSGQSRMQLFDTNTDDSNRDFNTAQNSRSNFQLKEQASSFSSPPSRKKKKKVMFALPPEDNVREKHQEPAGQSSNHRMDQQSSFKSNGSDEEYTTNAMTFDQPQNEFFSNKGHNSRSNLTSQNIANFNDEQAERDHYMMRKSASQPQMTNTQQVAVFEQNSLNNDSQLSDSQQSIPKYSPVKRSNPNKKYIPTQQFVTGEGTAEDKTATSFLVSKSQKEKQYQTELFQQMEERRLKKENERQRLKDEELMEEARIKRELLEMQNKEMMEKENKKKHLGDIMERYQQEERDKRSIKFQESDGKEIMIRPPQEHIRPIQVEMPPGAQYAQYSSKDQDDPNHYDYSKDYEKFDILDRGHRAAVSGVPRAKLLADIGHDLKGSIHNEVEKIRQSIRVQHLDFKDQLSKMTTEAKYAIDERDRVKNHLHQLRNELRVKREDQMQSENELVKTLNKYKLEPQKYHYPQRPYHLEHTAPKPEEKKTIYEKMFFDKISNKIESEKLNPPLQLYREATQNPQAQITIGKGQYYANSKGQLNTESTLVTLDNKQLYPQKPIYEMPDLESKTSIVNWKREPYEYYHNRVKDMHPRNEMYIVKNNYENKFAHRINDDLNYQRFALPEREEHRPQYNSSIKPIDLASINIEKIHQVNEMRLTRLDRDYRTPHSKGKGDIDLITDLFSLKM